ncbi:MAG: PorT family protein [Bacteroidetes bacterium]|nr:PorT family protein [Bacteroidota bacterium]MCL1969204.1 PorT family protein [Bacteroidota bacterium]
MQKGILILLSFIFFISIYAQKEQLSPAQSEGLKEGQSNFRAGVRIGFSCSQITGDGFPFQGFNKFGAFAGPFVNFPITKNGKWFIQTELNFIMKGCKHVPKFNEYGNIVGPVIHQYVLQLMYGEIPLLVKWKIIKGLELELGPAFGILFKNTDVEKVDGYINIGAPPFFRFEFAGIIGVNYRFYKHLGASLRYEGSFLPVRKHTQHDYTYLLAGQHNQTFCFSVYYQF